MNMIETKHLTKSYAGFTAVSDVSLHIPKGAVYGFLGPNVPRYEQETGSLFRHLQLWRELYT